MCVCMCCVCCAFVCICVFLTSIVGGSEAYSILNTVESISSYFREKIMKK